MSGYVHLAAEAKAAGIPYQDFENINSPATVALLRKWAPDVIFVVGLSQLVKREVLALPRLGCVGYHPTRLPEGRGRAPVAWMTLEGRSGASTFFIMNEEADAGPILAQEPYPVTEADYAADVTEKLEAAIDRALDRWLPKLKAGEWAPRPQNEAAATFYGKRAPEDGAIDWNRPAREIHALVRASSRPYPGAYTAAGGRKLIVWRAEVERKLRYRGITGRILLTDPAKGCLVQTGAGLLWLTDTEFDPPVPAGEPSPLRVGAKLGYDPQAEILLLRARVAELERKPGSPPAKKTTKGKKA